MASFPEFIIPMSGGPLQHKLVQVPQLNIAPLMQSLTPMPKRTGTKKKGKTTKEEEDEIAGLEGLVNQIQGNKNKLNSELHYYQSTFGEDAQYLPSYRQLKSTYERVNSPEVINALNRRTARTDLYEKNTKDFGDRFNLEQFSETGGLVTAKHRELVDRQNKAMHPDLPNLYGNALVSAGGESVDLNPQTYIPNLGVNPNSYGPQDALDHLNKIFDKGDNQFQENAIAYIAGKTVDGITGTGSVSRKDADDFYTLRGAEQEALRESGIPIPKVKRDSNGHPMQKMVKKGNKWVGVTDNRGNKVYDYVYETDENGNVKTNDKGEPLVEIEGGAINYDSPLGAGLMQDFLANSFRGTYKNGKSLRHAEDQYDANGRLVAKKGTVNEDFYLEFNSWVRNKIADHYEKRANVQAAASESFYQDNKWGAKSKGIQDSFYDILAGAGTKVNAIPMKADVNTPYPINTMDEKKMQYYSDILGLPPSIAEGGIFKRTINPADGKEYLSFNKDYDKDALNKAIDKHVEEAFGHHTTLGTFINPETGAVVAQYEGVNDKIDTSPGEWINSGAVYTKDEYKKMLKDSYRTIEDTYNRLAINKFNGLAQFNDITFAESNATKEVLEQSNYYKTTSNKIAGSKYMNRVTSISPGSFHDAESIYTDSHEVSAIGNQLVLTVGPRAGNFGVIGKNDQGEDMYGYYKYVTKDGKQVKEPTLLPNYQVPGKETRGVGDGLLPLWDDESFQNASELAQAKWNDPQGMKIAPTKYMVRQQVKVPVHDVQNTLKKWSKMKVYDSEKGLDHSVSDRYTADIKQLIIAKNNYEHGMADADAIKSAKHVYKNLSKGKYSRKYSENDIKKIFSLYDGSAKKSVAKTAEVYLRSSHGGAHPSQYLTRAVKPSFYQEGKEPWSNVETFKTDVGKGNAGQWLQSHTANQMEIFFDDDGNMYYHNYVDVGEIIDNSAYLQNNSKLQTKFRETLFKYHTPMQEGQSADLEVDLRSTFDLSPNDIDASNKIK